MSFGASGTEQGFGLPWPNSQSSGHSVLNLSVWGMRVHLRGTTDFVKVKCVLCQSALAAIFFQWTLFRLPEEISQGTLWFSENDFSFKALCCKGMLVQWEGPVMSLGQASKLRTFFETPVHLLSLYKSLNRVKYGHPSNSKHPPP